MVPIDRSFETFSQGLSSFGVGKKHPERCVVSSSGKSGGMRKHPGVPPDAGFVKLNRDPVQKNPLVTRNLASWWQLGSLRV